MTEHYVVATLVAKPEKADALRDLLVGAVDQFRAEDGCLGYSAHEDIHQPGRFVTYERWRDAEAAQAHMSTPLMGSLLPQLPDLLAAEFQQDFLKPLKIA